MSWNRKRHKSCTRITSYFSSLIRRLWIYSIDLMPWCQVSFFASIYQGHSFLIRKSYIQIGIDVLQDWPEKIIQKLDQCNETREQTITARKEIQLLSRQLGKKKDSICFELADVTRLRLCRTFGANIRDSCLV